MLEKHPFGKPLHIPLMLLYHTGMRVSEVVGLTWDEIDFDMKRINLSRQILYYRKGGYHLSTLKTKTSKRYIIIDDELTNELKHWKEQQEENEKAIDNNYAYAYVDEDGHITWRSKMFAPPEGNKIGIVCTRNNGLLVKKVTISMSSAERSYFVMGNLVRAYHNKQNKYDATVENGTVMLGNQAIITPVAGDEDAQTIADRLNALK
ncbi:MAG: tyrosine-type recombinase/integrase [Selenomonadaceae bacterium]|nr:tyrosine-type recombinase/integrase [Selenomonadaceae bacterium]